MLGAIIVAVLIIVIMPVGLLMSSTIIGALFSWIGTDDAEARYEGSELIDLS